MVFLHQQRVHMSGVPGKSDLEQIYRAVDLTGDGHYGAKSSTPTTARLSMLPRPHPQSAAGLFEPEVIILSDDDEPPPPLRATTQPAPNGFRGVPSRESSAHSTVDRPSQPLWPASRHFPLRDN